MGRDEITNDPCQPYRIGLIPLDPFLCVNHTEGPGKTMIPDQGTVFFSVKLLLMEDGTSLCKELMSTEKHIMQGGKLFKVIYSS